MICFGREGVYSLSSPLTKRPGRSLMRQIIQSMILVGMILLAYRLGHGVWSPSNLDPRDLDFVQALCSGQQQEDGLGKMPPVNREKLEYDQASHLQPESPPDMHISLETWQRLPVRGALYMMVRNENLQDARIAMRSVEDRFNKHLQYPWILLSNQDFSPSFRKYICKATDAPIYFGKVDLAAWEYPSWINVPLAENKMREMTATGLYMAGSVSFRQMLRYQSGLFVHHPLFEHVDYVWRVEPGSSYSCDMEFDPFRFMKENNKTLGFTLTMRESVDAIPGLWSATRAFMEEHPESIMQANTTIMPWITDEKKSEYNRCHIWSNFEIVETLFLRSREYQKYFSYLDHRGGFFYERWGDAPVRTIAAAMFLPREKIHFFNRIGYTHSVASHCPINKEYNRKCSCSMFSTYDFHPDSCTASLLPYIDEGALQEMVSFAESHLDKIIS